MPILIEQAQALSPKEQQDLYKIYADYPLDEVRQRLDAFIDSQLSNSWTLIHARFNDSLIGAMWIKNTDGHQVAHDLCVRDITRHRGVATRLLEVTLQQTPTLQHAPIPQHIPEPHIIAHLINKFAITTPQATTTLCSRTDAV